MADVAALAGVSHQTVSRVLNGHRSVRPATREKVLEAIAQLGYRRNSAARALVTARTATVRSEEHTSELQSRENLVCRLLLEKKNKNEAVLANLVVDLW